MSEIDRERVLVFAPIGRDAVASSELLRRVGLTADVCVGLPELIDGVREGVGVVFLAEEGLFGKDATALFEWVDQQPAWADLPFVILTSHQEQPAVTAWRQRLVASLRNVSLLERPVQGITLTSTVQAAVRARQRQYEVQALLEGRERAAHELEAIVVARTQELEKTNSQLRTQMAERAKIEEALRHSQKIEAIGQLTGGVAHDFNNLLMVITSGLEMLDRRPDLSARVVGGMRQAAQRGIGLTRQLLAFSRRQPLEPEPVDIGNQIAGMRELLDRSLRGDVGMRLEIANGSWPIEVDPGELELVLLNLAVNARDAMPSGGTIVIKTENLSAFEGGVAKGDYVRLSVQDQGIGMPPDVAARAFEPFFTTKEVGKGSGLGLSQVHGFATQSGGTVSIESAEGHGTTVALILPRSVRTPPAKPEHLIDLRIARSAPGASGSVLLVEDDDEVAALTADMLEELGYDVLRASSASAALGALANGRRVDILFSDIMMPGGMNGVDLAREIRNRRQQLPVLLTSGYAEAAKKDAEAVGVRVLPKPYGLDELDEALKTAIAEIRAEDLKTGTSTAEAVP